LADIWVIVQEGNYAQEWITKLYVYLIYFLLELRKFEFSMIIYCIMWSAMQFSNYSQLQ